MRARVAIVLLFVLVAPLSARPALAGPGSVVVAQEEEADQGPGGGAEAETGAGQGQTQETPAEPGPPWTFQMAWIGGVMVLFLLAGIGWWYYRLVVKRQRGEI